MPESDNNNLPDFLTPNEIKFINNYREFVKTHELKQPDSPFLKNLQAKIAAVTQEEIDNVRKELLDYLAKNKENLKIADRFVKEFTLDVYLRGFIAREHKNLIEKIVEAMEALSETQELNDETFPKELLEFGVNLGTGFDLYGNPVFYLFAKRNYAPRKLFDATEKYMVYIVFQLVRISLLTNGFFTMFVDFSSASVSNVDFNALRLLITILNDYAPACLNRIILYNIHFLLKPAIRIGYTLLPSSVGDMMHTVSPKDLNKFVSKDQLTTYIDGGLNSEIVLGRPKKNNRSFLEVSHKANLPAEEASKLIEQFRKALKKNKLELLPYE